MNMARLRQYYVNANRGLVEARLRFTGPKGKLRSLRRGVSHDARWVSRPSCRQPAACRCPLPLDEAAVLRGHGVRFACRSVWSEVACPYRESPLVRAETVPLDKSPMTKKSVMLVLLRLLGDTRAR